MKVAVIGSRGLAVDNLGDYLPEGTDEIVSGEPVAENEQAELPSLSGENSVEVYLPTEEEKDSPVAALLNALAALGK